MSAVKMDIKEFREKGYLQEVNRRFFHPLGLALEVTVGEDGEEYLSGIWDYRSDSEGIYYNVKNSTRERIEKFRKNAEFIDKEFNKRRKVREKLFGSIVEPLGKEVSRSEALKLSRQILIDAERERLAVAESEAAEEIGFY